jgi:hypothetical protein
MNFNLLPKKPLYSGGMELLVTGSDTLNYIGLKEDKFFSKIMEIPGIELDITLSGKNMYIPFVGRMYGVGLKIPAPIGSGKSSRVMVNESTLERSLNK